MSIRLVIDLADQKAIEKLTVQVENLRKENHKLISFIKKQMENDRFMVQKSLQNLTQTQVNLQKDMFELSKQQKIILERISQLCQDSDQFMEVQKSINDIWEIMKVVWVDSLLNDYQKSINGESTWNFQNDC